MSNKTTWTLFSVLVIVGLVLAACAPAQPTSVSEFVPTGTNIVNEVAAAAENARPTDAPAATEIPATAEVPTVTELPSKIGYPITCDNSTETYAIKYTVELHSNSVQEPWNTYCSPDDGNWWATMEFGGERLQVNLAYSEMDGWSCSYIAPESWKGTPCIPDSDGNARIIFGDTLHVVLKGNLLGQSKGCNLNEISRYGTFEGDAFLPGEIFAYVGNHGYIHYVECLNGEISGLLYLTEDVRALPADTLIYFGTGNMCRVSRDGLGLQWLDVQSTGLHLPLSGQLLFSRCEYHAPITATPTP